MKKGYIVVFLIIIAVLLPASFYLYEELKSCKVDLVYIVDPDNLVLEGNYTLSDGKIVYNKSSSLNKRDYYIGIAVRIKFNETKYKNISIKASYIVDGATEKQEVDLESYFYFISINDPKFIRSIRIVEQPFYESDKRNITIELYNVKACWLYTEIHVFVYEVISDHILVNLEINLEE